MARIHTHYDNLKVARDAPPEVIRAAYKTLSQKYHPDRNGDSVDAIRVIQLINSAYAVLSDPDKRREHDDWIARTEALHHSAAAPGFHECSVMYSERKKSKRSRRRNSFGFHFHGARYMHSPSMQRMMHKLRMILDHFSRKLFGKT
jgi:DnaJ-class molecular chaperone